MQIAWHAQRFCRSGASLALPRADVVARHSAFAGAEPVAGTALSHGQGTILLQA